MDHIRIAVLNTHDQVCAYMDNSAPKALHYYDDELHEYLQGSAYTYTFSASARHEDSEYLTVGNKIAFVYRNKDYYLNIMSIDRDEYEVTVEAFGLSMELLNEYTNSYKASKAMTVEEYITAFNFANILTIGVNEVSDKAIIHEWTGTDTILARLFSLATVFSAEAEFIAELNDDYSLKRIVLNLYKEHDDNVQGIGTNREDITLRYGVNVSGIRKKSDITELYTAIRPFGRDNLTVTSLDKKEYDADGNLAYESPSGNRNILAVLACEQFPSNLLGTTTDRYICEIWSYDTDNVNTLYGQALAQLKKHCVPQVEYEVEGYFDADIGDTVSITDEEYTPPLYLTARVSEQVRSFTDPAKNKTTFSNFIEQQSQVSEALLAKMEALIEANKTYICSAISNNGIVFKNGEGTTTLTASVRDGAVDVTDDMTITWTKDGVQVSTGKTLAVSGADITDKAVYRFEAQDASGVVRGFYEVTVSNVSDGKAGEAGADGSGVKRINTYARDFTTSLWQNYGTSGKTVTWSTGTDYDNSHIKLGDTAYLTGTVSDAFDSNGNKISAALYGVVTAINGTNGSTSIIMNSSNLLMGAAGADGQDGFSPTITVNEDSSLTIVDQKGEHTTDPLKGRAGLGIQNISIYYAVSSSNTEEPQEWSTAIKNTTMATPYLWCYERYTYTDGTFYDSTKRVIGTHGQKGEQGEDGKDAAIISSTEPSDQTMLWCDTSVEPPVIKQYNGTEWVIVNDQSVAIQQIYTDVYESINEASNSIMLQVGENIYDKDAVDQLIGNVSTQYEQAKDAFDFKFNQFLANLNDLSTNTDERFTEVSKYIRFVDGAIVIGIEGNPLILRMKNDRISFMENGNEVAYISNQKMYITDAEVTSSMTIGNFAFVPRNNGNLSFKKVR